MTRYEKTFPEDGDVDQFAEHSGPMLAMLVASRGPLSVKVVSNAGVDEKVKQKRSWKEKRRRHLEFVKTMCVGSLVDVGLLQFSHKSFSDWLLNKKKNKTFRVRRKKAEELMASACWKELRGGGGRKGDDGSSNGNSSSNSDDDEESDDEEEKDDGDDRKNSFLSYALTHGVSHLVAAKRKGDAKTLILDVDWLMARASDGVRLMDDCQLLKEDRTVAAIRSAVGLSLSYYYYHHHHHHFFFFYYHQQYKKCMGIYLLFQYFLVSIQYILN
jgi:hypothetical protein